MKLIYIANIRLPTEKAHGLQIMKMCEVFVRQGIEVELVVPWRFNKIKENPFEYYGVEKIFRITKVPSIDLVKFGKIGFLIQSFTFAKFAFFYVLFKKADIIYSRDALPLFFLGLFRKNIFCEMHDFPLRFFWFWRTFLKKLSGLIYTNSWKADAIQRLFGDIVKNKIVLPNAVDLKEFDIEISKEKARSELNLPLKKVLIGYIGMLRTMGMEKGIDIAIESLKYLDRSILLTLVGGDDEDIRFYQDLAKNLNLQDRIIFVGRVIHKSAPKYLKAFDILIAPFPETEHYKFYMSPLKMFEYMASKRPIVTSDLPSIREILNENNAVLVKPDDPQALAEGIKKILQNPGLSDKISEQAFKDVQKYTWQKRAQKILDFIYDKNI